MACDEVRAALSAFDGCLDTEEGSRIATHCLYPSFENVHVFIAKFGDGFRVHDGGGASRVSWVHGRDYALIRRVIARQATRYAICVSDTGDTLYADAKSAEWLTPAILAVANASASSAHLALERMVSATEAQLSDRIYETLLRLVPEPSIAKRYEIPGKSGKQHSFDFAVKSKNELILLDAVAPHHISISAKYVAFADVAHRVDGRLEKFAVHDRPLERSDESLLLQVATLIPYAALDRGMKKVLVQ